MCVEFVAGSGQAFGLGVWGLWVVCNERSLCGSSDTSGHEARKLGKIFEASTTLKGGKPPPKIGARHLFRRPKNVPGTKLKRRNRREKGAWHQLGGLAVRGTQNPSGMDRIGVKLANLVGTILRYAASSLVNIR